MVRTSNAGVPGRPVGGNMKLRSSRSSSSACVASVAVQRTFATFSRSSAPRSRGAPASLRGPCSAASTPRSVTSFALLTLSQTSFCALPSASVPQARCTRHLRRSSVRTSTTPEAPSYVFSFAQRRGSNAAAFQLGLTHATAHSVRTSPASSRSVVAQKVKTTRDKRMTGRRVAEPRQSVHVTRV